MTKIIDNKNGINEEINDAAKALNEGKIVIFPTETVYGIGVDATNEKAVDDLFITKNRSKENPVNILIGKKEDLNDLVEKPNIIEQRLIDNFMPGPLTLILKKKKIIPDNVTANTNYVGIRIPKNDIALKLLEKTNKPLATPSANISGKPSGTNIKDIYEEFNGKVEYIIDGGEAHLGVESTVVKVIDGIPTILRPGGITPEQIINVCGTCDINKNIFKDPSSKFKHYAPNTKCIVVYSENSQELEKLVKENITKQSIVIGKEELQDTFNCMKYLSYGNTYEEISHNIFTLLRQIDKYNADKVIIIGVRKEGLGIAIMNRIIKSASYNYIER